MKFSLVLFKYDTVGRCGFAKFKDFSLAISLANHNLQLMKMPRFLGGSAIIPPKVIIHSSFKVKWKNTLTCVTMSLHRSDIDLPCLFCSTFYGTTTLQCTVECWPLWVGFVNNLWRRDACWSKNVVRRKDRQPQPPF